MGKTENTGLGISPKEGTANGSNQVDDKIDELLNKPSRSSSKEMSQKGKQLLNEAKTEEVKDLIKQLYRPGASIGDGGTADALREEKKNSGKVGNKGHEKKAAERVAQIKRILAKNPNHPDKDLLIKLLNDLEDALYGGK